MNVLLLYHSVKVELLFDVLGAYFGKLCKRNHSVTVTVREAYQDMDLEWCDVKELASLECCFTLLDSDFTSVLFIFPGQLHAYLCFEAAHPGFHHLADSDLVPDVVEHVRELGVPDPILPLQTDQQVLLLRCDELGRSDDVLEMLKGNHTILDFINLLKAVAKDVVCLGDLVPVDELKSLGVRVLHLLRFLPGDVPAVEGLDSLNTNRNELFP